MPADTYTDIISDDRIDAIRRAPRHYNLSAFRAKVILDWIPDTGQYHAHAPCRAQNGLFRWETPDFLFIKKLITIAI